MDANYSARLDDLVAKMRNVPDHTRRDLNKLYANCRGLADILSKEAVNCRRLHTKTATYRTVEDKLIAMIDELEQWITFASLL